MNYFLDYISFTLHIETEIPGVALAYFHRYVPLELEGCITCKGINFYKQSLVFPSGIRILFDGKDGMGMNITIPGLGLKSDHMSTFSVFDMVDKLRDDKIKFNISRVDIAVDSDVDFSYFMNKFNRRQFVCRYDKENIRKHVNLDDRGTLYFGKRGSLTMFRIYDKALEQGVDGVWTRIEMECRNEACGQILEAFRNGEVKNYFLGHLKFVDKRVSNMQRATVSKRYLKVLEYPIEPKKIQRIDKDNTLEWFITQVAPALKALKKYYGTEMIDNIVENSKMSKKQIKDRFDMRVLNKEEKVNLKTGEVIRLDEKYIQLCLEMIKEAV